MNEIRFSNDYHKLPVGWLMKGFTGQEPEWAHATLISVTRIDLAKLRIELPGFIAHDISIRCWHDRNGFFCSCPTLDKQYKLPANGDVLVLIFIHKQTGRLFSTIRRWTAEKERWYTANIMQGFQMVYTGVEG
jgi:hypothetical protein